MTQEIDREPMLEMFIFTVKNSLEQLEQAALTTANTSLEPAALSNIMKIIHTIRGSSGMMKYTNISSLAHSAEDLFSFVQECQPAAVDFVKLTDITLSVSDFIKGEVTKLEHQQAADGEAQSLLVSIEEYLKDLKTVDDSAQAGEVLRTYQADIFFEDDCEMENVRAFSVLHNLGQIAEEITHQPDDIDSSESSQIIQQQGFHICFKSLQSVEVCNELLEKTPFLKDFKLCEVNTQTETKTRQIVLDSPLAVHLAGNEAKPQSKEQSEKIQSAAGGEKTDKGVERMAEGDVRHEDTQKGKFLTFSVGKEYYGIAIRYVTEIIGGIQAITEVPELPEYVKGIINLRGTIIPVMDIRLRFKKEPKAYTDRTCIVVVNIKDIFIGLIVDAVSEVLTIAEQEIVAPPAGHKSFQNRYIKGIGKVGSDVKLLLDCNKLINDEEFEALTNIQ
ncbi:MAG: chemotaxis protein CheW [Pelosinus sp.]|nr:chemotaxis protein CheW [Pelosinus sp.]